MSPMRIPFPTEFCFSIALASSSLIYASPGGAAQGQEGVVSNKNLEKAFLTFVGAHADFVVDSKVKKWSKFQSLVKQWRLERGATSSITVMSGLTSYQKIIGMGDDAVPMILSQLKSEGDEPDQWFWALKMITDLDPVRPEDRGNFVAMAQAWLAWGESEEYARYLAA
jgi:hypothetical protein